MDNEVRDATCHGDWTGGASAHLVVARAPRNFAPEATVLLDAAGGGVLARCGLREFAVSVIGNLGDST